MGATSCSVRRINRVPGYVRMTYRTSHTAQISCARTHFSFRFLLDFPACKNHASWFTFSSPNYDENNFQVTLWKAQGIDKQMPLTLWHIYCLLAGRLDELPTDPDWRVGLALYYWYRVPPCGERQSLESSLAAYRESRHWPREETTAPSENVEGNALLGRGRETRERQYKLIQAVAVGAISADDLTLWEDRSSLELTWCFCVVLRALKKCGPKSDAAFSQLSENFSTNLLRTNQADWALFVASFLPSSKNREAVTRYVLKTAGTQIQKKWPLPDCWELESRLDVARQNADPISMVKILAKLMDYSAKLPPGADDVYAAQHHQRPFEDADDAFMGQDDHRGPGAAPPSSASNDQEDIVDLAPRKSSLDLALELAETIVEQILPKIMLAKAAEVKVEALMIEFSHEWDELCEFALEMLGKAVQAVPPAGAADDVGGYGVRMADMSGTPMEFLCQYKDCREQGFKMPFHLFWEMLHDRSWRSDGGDVSSMGGPC